MLDRWVEAKRGRDFGTADRLRDDLRAQGIDPEKERPLGGKSEILSQGWAPSLSAFTSPAASFGWGAPDAPVQPPSGSWQREVELDEWVEAKRAKDFATA